MVADRAPTRPADSDAFDPICDHILVVDHDAQEPRAFGRRAPRIEARYLWSIEATPDGLLLGTGLGLYESRAGRVRAIDPAVERIRCSLQTGDALGELLGRLKETQIRLAQKLAIRIQLLQVNLVFLLRQLTL